MGHVGHFGKLDFAVKLVDGKPYALSFSNMKWDTSINVEEHKRQGQKPLLEVTNRNCDKVTMNISLCASMGVSPLKKLLLLRNYNLKSKVFPLGIGGSRIGGFKWLITDISNDIKAVYIDGRLMSVEASVTFKEYPYKKGKSKKKKIFKNSETVGFGEKSKNRGYDKYIVQAGDTLWTLAKKLYGKSSLYYRIYNANKKKSSGFDVIANPTNLTKGLVIKIPK